MKTKLNFKSNFSWAFVGNASIMFFSWLLMIVLTKIGTVEKVGDFAVAQAVGLPVNLFFSLKLSLVQVTDIKNEFAFGHYLMLKIITSTLIAVIIAAIGFIFYQQDMAIVIACLGLNYALLSFRDIFLAVMQKNERMDLAAVSGTIQGVLTVILFSVVFIQTSSLFLGILALFVARLITLIFYDRPVSRRLLQANVLESENKSRQRPNWDMDQLYRIIAVSLPLGFVALLTTVFNSAPRLILDNYAGKAQVGYYAAISSLLVIGDTFMSALSSSIVPRLASSYVENKKDYNRLVRMLMVAGLGIGFAGILVSIVFGRQILTLMFTPEYAEHTSTLIELMIAGCALILFSCMNIALTAARKFKIQLPIYVIAAASCIVSSLLLIPPYGLTGAAISYMIGNTIGFVCCAVVVFRSR